MNWATPPIPPTDFCVNFELNFELNLLEHEESTLLLGYYKGLMYLKIKDVENDDVGRDGSGDDDDEFQ